MGAVLPVIVDGLLPVQWKLHSKLIYMEALLPVILCIRCVIKDYVEAVLLEVRLCTSCDNSE